jgi:competence protein ComEC
MDPALFFGLLLVAGGVACVAPAQLVVGAVATALLFHGGFHGGRVRARRGLVVAAALVLAIGGGRAWRAIARHERARAEAWASLPSPSRCTAEGEAVSSPVLTHGVLRWDAELASVRCEGAARSPGRAVRVGLYGGPDDLARGDRFLLTAQLATVERFWNSATGDPRPSDTRRGTVWSGSVVDLEVVAKGSLPLAFIDRARAYVRRRIGATFPDDAGAMARALVLGESDLSDADDADFRSSGLAHLLAVSGMHLVLVVAGAMRVARALLVRIPGLAATHDVGRWTAGLAIPLLWVYAELAGAGGSTLRAAWMMTASLLARTLGARSTAPRAFGLSLLAMGVADPLVAFDLSFLLSAGATGGLIALARPVEARLVAASGRLPSVVQPAAAWLARAVAPTLAATLPCTPVLARFAPTQPLGGVVANLLAVPLGEAVALPLCLLHAVAAPLPPVEQGAAYVATGALRLVRLVAHAFAHFRPLLVPVPPPSGWQLACFALGLVALGTSKERRRRPVLAGLAALLLLGEAWNVRAGSPRGVLRATFLDVGQGDAALVDLPDGEGLLIDGGGLVGSPVDTGTRVIAPTLRARRRSSLAAVVLSHPHPDHFTGLASGLDGVRVGALWDTGQGEREGVGGGYATLLRTMRDRGVPVLRPGELCDAHGGARALGGATVEVLAPCPDASVDRGPNDNSIVVRIAFGRRAFLFVGDSEREAERDLLALGAGRLRADVLKVGHHGSRTSTSPAFLAAVAPAFAVVSTGLRNRFGHPHPTTLETLRRAGVRSFRTDTVGAVTAWTDGDALRVGAESDLD